MSAIRLRCSLCKRSILRHSGRVNEGKKFGWKTYCSLKCLGLSRRTTRRHTCSRPECNNTFLRTPSDFKKSKKFFCSHRCAMIVNNKEYPRNPGVLKICAYCKGGFKSREKYCSRKCKDLGSIIPSEELLGQIRRFVITNGRIPYKREIEHYHAFRLRFGNWNNAIKTAGFDPNPVMFANKHIAKDGHKCDSFAEKIIDNWFFERKIAHTRSFPYPGNKGFTCDFVIGDKWVEFFGLSGELGRYDKLMRRKLNLVKKYKLDLIKIYPKDLLPISNLKERLDFL